jgi:prepilin-type N-terminal cleavage/methylation domain-containing protein
MKLRQGFSLIEVVIAIGVIAVALTALLGLMAGMSKSMAESAEREGAERVIVGGIAELERLGAANALAKINADGALATGERVFYESRDARQAGWGTAVSITDRFYAFAAYRIENVSPASADGTGRGVALVVRVEWPANSTNRSSVQQTHVLLR